MFYVHIQKGRDKITGKPIFDENQVVAAKFLVVIGQKVVDANQHGSQENGMYRRLTAGRYRFDVAEGKSPAGLLRWDAR